MTEKLNTLLENIESVKKLDVKDGDVLVIKMNSPMSLEGYVNFKAAVKQVMAGFGYNIHPMIFENVEEIGVLRKENREEHGREEGGGPCRDKATCSTKRPRPI